MLLQTKTVATFVNVTIKHYYFEWRYITMGNSSKVMNKNELIKDGIKYSMISSEKIQGKSLDSYINMYETTGRAYEEEIKANYEMLRETSDENVRRDILDNLDKIRVAKNNDMHNYVCHSEEEDKAAFRLVFLWLMVVASGVGVISNKQVFKAIGGKFANYNNKMISAKM
jgi:hypothetical protein